MPATTENKVNIGNTVFIEQTAKNIKLVKATTQTLLFASIATGLGGMYLFILEIVMFFFAGVVPIDFLPARVWCWWMHG